MVQNFNSRPWGSRIFEGVGPPNPKPSSRKPSNPRSLQPAAEPEELQRSGLEVGSSSAVHSVSNPKTYAPTKPDRPS